MAMEMSAVADGLCYFGAHVSGGEGGNRGGCDFQSGYVSLSITPREAGQAFLETLVPRGILVLCNIFRGFSLHGQAKVTQS